MYILMKELMPNTIEDHESRTVNLLILCPNQDYIVQYVYKKRIYAKHFSPQLFNYKNVIMMQSIHHKIIDSSCNVCTKCNFPKAILQGAVKIHSNFTVCTHSCRSHRIIIVCECPITFPTLVQNLVKKKSNHIKRMLQ